LLKKLKMVDRIVRGGRKPSDKERAERISALYRQKVTPMTPEQVGRAHRGRVRRGMRGVRNTV